MPLRRVLLAKNVAIVVVPMAVDETNGNMTPVFNFAVTGRAGTLRINRKNETERTDADDASGADRARTKEDWTLTLEAVKLTTASYPTGQGDLLDVMDTYYILQVDVRIPRGPGFKTDRYTGIIEDGSWDKNVGRNIDVLTLSRVETGARNPLPL